MIGLRKWILAPGVLLAALGAQLSCGTGSGERPGGEPQPNIVLILVDDLGLEGFGCYGGISIPTPRIDSLAAGGALYSQAHTTPLCTPTRVRMMTGRTGLRSYVDFSTLHPDEVTFARQLQLAGYETGVAGKWQLLGERAVEQGGELYNDEEWTGSSPAQAGFDSWCLWMTDSRGSRYFDPTLDINGETKVFEDGYGPDLFVDWAGDFMAEQRDAPFLLYYPMALPHDPFAGTPDSLPDSDATLVGESQEERSQRHFEDMVARVDSNVGRLLDRIEQLGIADETLVILTSDNSHSRKVSLAESDGAALRGFKNAPNDRGTRVPLLVRWPGKVEPASVVGGLVDLMDLMPTLVGAGRAELPDGVEIDGLSLLPTLLHGEPWTREVLTMWFHPRPYDEACIPMRWVRSDRYKLYGSGRFYDLEDSPFEGRQIRGEAVTEETKAIRAHLLQFLEQMPAEPLRVVRGETP